MQKNRRFDLVLFGATGYTGKVTAETIARSRPKDLKWAIAGRSIEKLRALREQLTKVDSSLAELPLIAADSSDAASLDDLAKETRLVCTTVGTYAKTGAGLVAACVRNGTDCTDITGEVQFIRAMIDAHHEEAKKTGARIVSACGFDSVPSDLGVWMMNDFCTTRALKLARVKYVLVRIKGKFGGGTIDSMLNLAEEASRDPKLWSFLEDPYSLNPPGPRGKDENERPFVRFDKDAQCVTGPFVMAAVNTRVVRRTNALLGFPYGEDFRYEEIAGFSTGPKAWIAGAGMAAGTAIFKPLSRFAPLRHAAAKVLPAPGEGPTREERTRSRFEIHLFAESHPNQSGVVTRARGVVAGGDPGYDETAKMLTQTSYALLDKNGPGGVLTPVATVGAELLPRLRNAGMTWTVDSLP